jgi:hypothetical protein
MNSTSIDEDDSQVKAKLAQEYIEVSSACEIIVIYIT